MSEKKENSNSEGKGESVPLIKYSKTRERFVHGETIVSVKYQRKCRKRDACNPLSSCLPPQQSVVGQFNDRTNDCPPLVRVHDPFSFVPATIPANHAVRRSDSVWRMRGKFFFFFSFLFLAQCPVSPPPIRYHSFVNSLRIIILQY